MIQSVFENIQVSGIMAIIPKQRQVLEEKYKSVFGLDEVNTFSKTVGVSERRIAGEKQTASDLAFVAAKELLERRAINKKSIGVLIFVTQTPDYRIPATACVLHKRLGLQKDCIALDINLGCSGYIYGMQSICSLMQSTGRKHGLLLVGDTPSKVVAPEDKSTTMLFGDGGSATLLETKEGASVIRTACWTKGAGFKTIIVPSGSYRNRKGNHNRTLWADGNKRSDFDLYMNGVDVFSFSISEVPDSINEFFQKTGEKKESYDAYIFHQANVYILKQLVKRCKLEKDKVPISMEHYGNTSVTSVPLTICSKYGNEQEQRKRKLFTCGFGVGLSWGIASLEIDQKDIYPVIETDEYYKDRVGENNDSVDF